VKVYRNIEEFENKQNAIVTTGTFDGVHFGHQKIITRLKEVAQQVKGETVIITFFPHPRLVLFPEDNDLKLINTLDEKIELLRDAGIDHLIIIPFTKEFSRLSSLEFVQEILVKRIGTKRLVIGYDHHFGKNREGSFEHLKQYAPEYGFQVEEIPEQDINDVAVSSTKIRNAILKGDVSTANTYLGYTFNLSGTVIKGDQIGRTIGYPTANIKVAEHYKLIPGDGIYASSIFIDNQEYQGMLYIGNRPTVNGLSKVIEVNIFNFDQDIYDKIIKVNFHLYIRGDKKLNGLEELKKALSEDKLACLEYFSKISNK
jgi:riboflavin kinase / FMN adenylyltransferase